MEREIVAGCAALLGAVLVGLWPSEAGEGGTQALRGALVEVTAPAGRRARPPWLGRPEQAGLAAQALGVEDGAAAAPSGPRAWLLGRRARISSLRTADWDELPGIGPSLLARIEAREAARGPMRSLAALDELPGVGPKRMQAIGLWLAADSPGHAVAPPRPSR